MAKASTGLMRAVFHDSVRMGCVHNVGWTAMVLRMLRQLGLGALADPVVHDVKAAIDNGDTDLQLPSLSGTQLRLHGDRYGKRTGRL